MATTDRFQFVEQMLEHYKAITMETLMTFLPEKEPRRYLYELVPLYPLRSGKGLRPGLCIATCGAFGGRTDRVILSAAAIELLHNAFLVHDDVEDGSEQRRGHPTLGSTYGAPIAINVGDAMNVLSLRPLMENIGVLGPELTWRVFREIEHMVHESVEGQAMELGWVRDNQMDLNEVDYLRMTLKKTCWYTCIHPCRIGSLVASGGTIDPDRFNRFGYYMGAAFQIQDDILNLIGDEARYGKEAHGDIWEGKRTVMLIHMLNHCGTRERRRMQRFLNTPRRQRSPDDVEWVFKTMQKYRSIDFARSCARQLAGGALREFGIAYGDQVDSEHKHFVEELVTYMVEREL